MEVSESKRLNMTQNHDQDKDIRYRAMKLAEARGISLEEALSIAANEFGEHETALKKARGDVFGSKGRKRQKRKNKRNKKKHGVVYTVDGSVVDRVFQGGAPGMGKNS